ncbi:MAG: glycosyltransferase, partial [Methylomonas sp.]
MLESKKAEMLSVVIPAYNEGLGIQSAILQVIDSVETCGVDWEIIVVDDGSRDETFRIVSALAESEPRIKALALSRNFGKEGAMLAGLEHSQGEVIIIMD